MDNSSLSHKKWNYKYHRFFAPKYRRKITYGKIKADVGVILRKICEEKGLEIIEENACKHHTNMLVNIPSKLIVY